MKKPLYVVVGVIVALLGLLFTLQGLNVMTGSSMSSQQTLRLSMARRFAVYPAPFKRPDRGPAGR
jgi:hypothetical protein